jgi:CHAD domain-containing protein
MRGDARYGGLHAAIAAAARQPAFTRRAGAPAAEALCALIDPVWRKLRKAVRRRSRPPRDAELHAIRIKAKRVRYAAEALAPYAGEAATTFARQAERLQTVLGDQHDAVVAAARLRALAAPAALIALEDAAAVAGRSAWRACWRALEPRRERFW